MFDARLRPLIDPPLNAMGRALVRLGVTANQATVAGALLGAAAGAAISQGWYAAGLGLILASRLLDGLDGAIARASRPTDFGGYLDILADYVFYIAVPVGFGLADRANLPAALILVGAFNLTAVSFLGFASIAARRGLETSAHGLKAFFYSTGLAEGAETIFAFVLACLWPAGFPVIALAFAGLCGLTVIQRTVIAVETFRNEP